jgi:prepilin-type N-terminal cleavage/methylation domain-containing protein
MKKFINSIGLTLVELLVTLALSAIILNFAVSNWSGLIERMTASQVKTNLRTAFSVARSSAVYDRQLVTLCPLDQNRQCVSDWSRPVSVFIDPDNSKSLSDAAHLIRVVPITTSGTLTPSATSHGGRRYFQYKPDGSTHGTIGNLTWCPQSMTVERAVQLRLNFGGRIRWAADEDGDGVVEDSSGQPIAC